MKNIALVFVFDGIDDYIEVPDSSDFSVATTGQLWWPHGSDRMS